MRSTRRGACPRADRTGQGAPRPVRRCPGPSPAPFSPFIKNGAPTDAALFICCLPALPGRLPAGQKSVRETSPAACLVNTLCAPYRPFVQGYGDSPGSFHSPGATMPRHSRARRHFRSIHVPAIGGRPGHDAHGLSRWIRPAASAMPLFQAGAVPWECTAADAGRPISLLSAAWVLPACVCVL